MKYFLKISNIRLARTCWTAGFVIALGWMVSARATLPSWIRNVEAGSVIEAALFRTMSLPGGAVLFRRPPAETRPALGELIKAQPHNAELYSLRALEDEQQLDFTAAELDWKKNAENAVDKPAAEIALADFYRRRLRPFEEIQVLSGVANAIPDAAEALTPSPQQRSWHAFERIFGVIQVQGLPADTSEQQYRAWLRRYPQEPALYARFLEYLLTRKDYSNGSLLIAEYRRHFPADQIFPIKAEAMLEYQRGSIQQGLAVYERTFQPLWAPELVKSYFDLLSQTQSQRKFLDQARTELNRNPDDANAMARVFYYYQQQGKLDSARQTVAAYRSHKESSKSEWRGQDLYICARLLEDIHAYPESARYYFALYNSKGLVDAQEQALAALTRLLLTAPESPIQLGSGDLSIYRDVATMDQGPGYLNGILSLILNTTAPGSKFAEEQQRALPYFHRSRAVELLNLLDSKFPNAAARPELHSALLQFYSNSAQSDAVIHGGKNFLANFPDAPQRASIALLMADAYARTDKTQEEFAIYDSVLQELAIKAHKLPLGARPAGEQHAYDDAPDARNGEQNQSSVENTLRQSSSMALQLSATEASDQAGTDSSEYSRVLERYLARLVQLKQVPQALAVLRREIETRQYVEAADAIDKMSAGERSAEFPAVASLELRVSAQTGTIDSILARYRTDPLNAPSSEVLRSAARQLLESGDKQSAGKILEFVFARDIEDHKMIAANFLGLAEIRIAQGDLPGAVGLLRRLVVVVGNPFENLDAAATLLEKTGHNLEAIEFLDELVKSAPWEPAYRVRLARAKTSAGHDPALAQKDLVAVASATTVPYSVRITAAVALVGGNRSSEIGSPELNLLAATVKPATSAADRPFFYDARLKAAEESSDLQVKIKLLGNALADTPSRDDARLPLFLAAAAARSDQFARAIIQPLLRQGFLNSVPAAAETGSDPMGDENYLADTQPDGSSISFSPPASVQQRQAAKALGNLLARLGRLDEASRYLRIALQLEDTAGGRNQIKSSIAEVNARLRRQRLNSQRQPILHEALEQDRLVRPRLVARTVPARIPPAKAGPKS